MSATVLARRCLLDTVYSTINSYDILFHHHTYLLTQMMQHALI